MNGILVVNKPPEHTSHDVVARLRGILRERRIGHGGTLDPMATGVLPVLVGRATRASMYLLGDKEYVAEMAFGVDTDTQDSTGQIQLRSDDRPTEDALADAIAHFTGEIRQIPPMTSAVKIQGKKLYELARRGIEIERPAREVCIHDISVLSFSPDTCTLRVRASKGTYIRTLVHDIGLHLGCYATMTALTRTFSEPYTLAQSLTLEEISLASANGGAESLLLPVDSLFASYPSVTVEEHNETLCLHGNPFPWPGELPPDSLCRVYGVSGNFLLLGRVRVREGMQYIFTEKNFFEVS